MLFPDFTLIKKKSKFRNLKKFDLSKTIPCKFDGFQAMTKAEFSSLALPSDARKRILRGDVNKFSEKFFYYYAFQENLNGNYGVVLLSCVASNELTCLVFDKKGQYLSMQNLAYYGGDMDIVWGLKGRLNAKGKYRFEYKEFLSTEDQMCEWYTGSFKFAKNGQVVKRDTTYKVKADPNVPCYEKKFD